MSTKWHTGLGSNFYYEPNDNLELSESERQRKMLVMVRRLFPDALIAHVPNGGHRDKIAGARMKADGVMAGWPDLIIAWDGGCAFPEVKDGTGTCSKGKDVKGRWIDGQQEVLTKLANMGHWCGVFRTDRALYRFLLDAGCPERIRYPHEFMKE